MIREERVAEITLVCVSRGVRIDSLVRVVCWNDSPQKSLLYRGLIDSIQASVTGFGIILVVQHKRHF